MKKVLSHIKKIKKQRGALMLESVLSMTLLISLVTIVSGAMLFGEESSQKVSVQRQAVDIVNETIDVVKVIREDDFDSLVPGVYGLGYVSDEWTLVGSPDTTNGFTRTIDINEITTDQLEVNVSVEWIEKGDARSVSLTSVVTNWLSPSDDPTFRVSEYYINDGLFSGTSYDLTLLFDLESEYFVKIEGADGSGENSDARGPDENYARLTDDPSGTGDLGASSGSNVLTIERDNAKTNWQGVVKVVECLKDCEVSGFNLVTVEDVNHGLNDSGSVTVSSGWTNLAQVVPFGGFAGAGCLTTATSNDDHPSCHSTFTVSGSDTLSWQRAGTSDARRQARSTVMLIEWGSEWTVQGVSVSGNSGGNGIDTISEYDTAVISQVVRDNTWVWGTGYTNDDGYGDSGEGIVYTLGDGVSQNSLEAVVAAGQEQTDTKNTFVYTMTHPSLNVDYRFKDDDGQSGGGGGGGAGDAVFTIDGGEVVIGSNNIVSTLVEVLGTAFTSSYPITTKFNVADIDIEPFGDYDNPSEGNINPDGDYSIDTGGLNAGDRVSIWGQSWYSRGGSYLEVDSVTGGQNVVVLRHGDSVPSYTPLDDQDSIETFLAPYIDLTDDTIILDDNQVIFLFELGTTNTNSSSFDMQDLVLLITFITDGGGSGSVGDGSEDLIYDIIVDDATDSGARLSIMFDSATGTSNSGYPRSHWHTRYISDGIIRAERERANSDWAAWVQGIDFSNISPSF